MNLFIGIGNITNLSERRKSKNGDAYISATLWTNYIGIEKQQKTTMINFQVFGKECINVESFIQNGNETDQYILIGYAKISPEFRGITIEKIVKVANEEEIRKYFEDNLWKIL